MGIEEDDFYYDGFPIIGCLSYNPDELLLTNSCTATENVGIDEVSFSNLPPQNYCISYIDIIDSTITTAKLASHTEVAKYYAIFLNSMAMIIRNFGAKIIKNAGDCLIYYFPRTSEPNNELAFKDVIECGITMISAHHIINARLYENKLPPLNFRISADYGSRWGGADPVHNSSVAFGNCMVRIPNSYNSKYVEKNPSQSKVRIVQLSNGYKPNVRYLLEGL